MHFQPSNAEALLLRESDRRLGLLKAVDRAIPNKRNQLYVHHSQSSLLRQWFFGLALGYENINDHVQLKSDPALISAVERNQSLSGVATLCRLENRM